jgi:hypothetical protein
LPLKAVKAVRERTVYDGVFHPENLRHEEEVFESVLGMEDLRVRRRQMWRFRDFGGVLLVRGGGVCCIKSLTRMNTRKKIESNMRKTRINQFNTGRRSFKQVDITCEDTQRLGGSIECLFAPK